MKAPRRQNSFLAVEAKFVSLLAAAFPYLVIFCVFQFGALVDFPVSIDDETAAYRTEASIWIAQGRWTNYLVESYLLPQPVVPFVPTLLFGILASIAFVLLRDLLFPTASPLEHGLAFALFAAWPVWAFILEFSANVVGLGIGVLSVVASVVCVARALDLTNEASTESATWSRGVWLCIGSIALLAVAIGAYQSFLFVFVTLVSALLLTEITRRQLSWRVGGAAGLSFALAVAGLAVSQIVNQIMMSLMNVQHDKYTSSFIDTGAVLGRPLQVIGTALADSARVYSGDAGTFGVPIAAIVLVYAVGVAALILLKTGIVQKLAMVVLLFAMFAAHLALELVTNNAAPLRAFVAAPFAVAIFAAFALQWSGPALRLVLLGSLAVVMFQLLVFAGNYDAGGRLRRQHDLALATQVYARIMEANPLKTHRDRVLVEFRGPKAFESGYKIPESGNSASFFEWDNGNPWRMILFMRLVGFVNLDRPSEVERARIDGAFAAMPQWPATGSVAVVDGVTLVKFGS